MTKPRVYMQGVNTYVIGTEDVQLALATLGISPDTHYWGSTGFGYFVRRQGYWRAVSELAPQPKDARAGVAFMGRIRPMDGADS